MAGLIRRKPRRVKDDYYSVKEVAELTPYAPKSLTNHNPYGFEWETFGGRRYYVLKAEAHKKIEARNK